MLDGVNVVDEVHAVLGKMATFCAKVRAGMEGAHGQAADPQRGELGIGGSDLGPVMACRGVRSTAGEMTFRFVSNVDGIDFVEGDAGP